MQCLKELLSRLVVSVVTTCIQLSVRTLHLLLGVSLTCRYVPSCRCYASEAVKEWGVVSGFWIAFRRVLRCQPWGNAGWDPVPRRK